MTRKELTRRYTLFIIALLVTGEQWGDLRNYDLMINTASIPIDAATHLITALYHSR